MPILNGRANAADLHGSVVELLNAYADAMAAQAVVTARTTGLPLTELIGIIVDSEDEVVAGVAKASEVVGELLETLPPWEQERLQVFLDRPVPATQLRVIAWNGTGLAMMRLDTSEVS